MVTTAARAAAIRLGIGSTVLACAWLLILVMPVAADGGPHQKNLNSGAATLEADTCAGCHRAHTASGEYLIKSPSITALCLNCHGDAGVGATTNIESGIQYTLANDGDGQPIAGALRSGGFVQARIDSAHSSRISYPWWDPYKGGYITTFSSKVGVLASGAAVTSAHIDLDGSGGVASKGKSWGNGATGSGAGPVVDLECTSCHNPHGNGQYRILAFIPTPGGVGFTVDDTTNTMTDAAIPTGIGAAGTRNYTVQNGRTLDQVTGSPTDGDYWRKFMPWNLVPGWNGYDSTSVPDGGHEGDVPMYVPSATDNLEDFKSQITLWCAACHQRYVAGTSDVNHSSGDPVYAYRHQNTITECTQCHVAHGSNAEMTGYSGQMSYPDGSAATSTGSGPVVYYNSRLLKIDNRGTCQACHDPTATVGFDPPVTISH